MSYHFISKGFPDFSIAREGLELGFSPKDLFFLILKASFLASSTTPVFGISPNRISIPLLSLKEIPNDFYS